MENNENHKVIADQRLSWKAKGIWLYAFNKPDGWKFCVDDFVAQSTDGKDSVRAGLKELIDCGYLYKYQKKTDSSQYSVSEWCFFETPKTPEEIKEMFPNISK